MRKLVIGFRGDFALPKWAETGSTTARSQAGAGNAPTPMTVPDRANARWSLDLVSGAFTYGHRLRLQAVVNDLTRACFALAADTSLSGRPGRPRHDAIIAVRGMPDAVVSDNGTELISRARCQMV